MLVPVPSLIHPILALAFLAAAGEIRASHLDQGNEAFGRKQYPQALGQYRAARWP